VRDWSSDVCSSDLQSTILHSARVVRLMDNPTLEIIHSRLFKQPNIIKNG
jgi:hypothetical protein